MRRGELNMQHAFDPRGWLKNPHVQSVLASSGLRGARARSRYPELVAAERPMIVDAGNGVRLSALMSKQPGHSQGLAVLIHGWEGSVHSSYLQSTGGRLFQEGWDVFRLNLRDHGDSHGLNTGLFHSCRLDEVVHAIDSVTTSHGAQKNVIAGFSLGGNFALRVLRALPGRFDFAAAICPPLVPKTSLIAIEKATWFYHAYFLMKWTKSLQLKQKLFPDSYNFASWKGLSIRQLTERLVSEHTDYASVDAYLDGYTIGTDRLQSISTPTLLIAAKDDPVIPVEDFYQLQRPANMELEVLLHGGHCGFLSNIKLESWVEARLIAALAQHGLAAGL
jgi:uncharacterized protein